MPLVPCFPAASRPHSIWSCCGCGGAPWIDLYVERMAVQGIGMSVADSTEADGQYLGALLAA